MAGIFIVHGALVVIALALAFVDRYKKRKIA
jgi:hypothetical protein